jgi:hypothetical protein
MLVWSPLASGLVAAFVVHVLTQSREREKWILDCKRQEFKELMSAITVSYLMTLQTHGSPIRTVDSEELRRLENAKVDALRVSWDRVFIVNDLPLNEIGNRWSRALGLYANRGQLDEEYARIGRSIVDAANRCVPKSAFQQLQFWRR